MEVAADTTKLEGQPSISPRTVALPIIGAIDRPAGFVLNQLPITIAGWAVGPTEISNIELLVGDVKVGTAVMGLSRPDVASAHQKYQFAGTSGFKLEQINVPIKGDTVQITALVNTVDGQIREITVSVRVFSATASALEYLGEQPQTRGELYVALAKGLIDANNLRDAELAIEALRVRCPDLPGAYVQQGRYLVRQNRMDEAEILLTTASKRFPSEQSVIGFHAEIATRRRDWREALLRWRAVRNKFPDYPWLLAEEGKALHGAAAESALLASAQPPIDSLSGVPNERNSVAASPIAYAELMLHFESLGHNCDFGSVQRHFGSEPLGLLRFRSAPLNLLVTALESRFDGVGHPDNTKFDVRPTDPPEYWVWDTRYDFSMHTSIYPSAASDEGAVR